MNIVETIFQEADRQAIALICDDEIISYGQLIERAEAAATNIAATPAKRIALDCPNGIAHVVLALAIVRTGKCLVPLASELSPRERERVIRETGVGAIVNESGGIREVPLADDPGFDEDALTALNPAFIRFSSGTTGTSKGVVISHETLLARITAANRGLRIGPADRIVWILPMAHHFAVSIMLYLRNGATTLIVNSHLAEDVLHAARRHSGTVLYGAPFHHALLAAETSGEPWPTLRLAVSTAAALPPKTAAAFDARYGVPLSQGLGVIEVGCRCSTCIPPAKNRYPWAVPYRISKRKSERATSFICAAPAYSMPTCVPGSRARPCSTPTAGFAPATSRASTRTATSFCWVAVIRSSTSAA